MSVADNFCDIRRLWTKGWKLPFVQQRDTVDYRLSLFSNDGAEMTFALLVSDWRLLLADATHKWHPYTEWANMLFYDEVMSSI